MKRNKQQLVYLELAGFKSIAYEHPLKLHFGRINILLGANGAGKSNVVSFFRMLGYMMSGSFQRFIAESGTNQKFLHYGSKKTPALSATIKFEGDDSWNVYSFTLANAVPNRLIVSSEEMTWKESAKSKPFTRPLSGNFNESALTEAVEKPDKTMRTLLGSCKVYQFSDSSQSAPMRQASTVDSAHYLQSEANNLASFLYYLKNNYSDSYRRIVSYVRGVVPQFGDFYLEPERGYITLKWQDNSTNDYILSPDQFSDGSIRFIALATLLLQPQQTMPLVIIVDEPELGLHPYAIDQLAEMIKDASTHAQVIVATQSPALIDGFSANDVTVIERDEECNCTVARHLNEDDYREWLDEYTLSELWNKNVIGGRPL